MVKSSLVTMLDMQIWPDMVYGACWWGMVSLVSALMELVWYVAPGLSFMVGLWCPWWVWWFGIVWHDMVARYNHPGQCLV